MSELVTGEAVALELRPARLPSRALAVLLDLAVVMAVYVAVTVALVAATASLDESAQVALSIATFLLVLVGGPIAVETLSHGRSLGKMACGLRVVRDDGGPIRFRHALVRGAIGVVEILMTFGVVACIASLVSARGRRLGDVFAGTLVVRERIPAGQAGFLPPPPPWLAGRFSALDLSAVPDGLWLAVRQYLTRMQQLDPQVGWGMAQRLAADVSSRTGSPVPPGIPPAMYLAAVLQERQAREARRAFGNTQAVDGSPEGSAEGSSGTSVGAAPAASPLGSHGFSVPPTQTQPQSMPPLPYPAAARSESPASGTGERSEDPSPGAPPAPVAPAEPAAPSAAARDAARTEPPATGFVPPA